MFAFPENSHSHESSTFTNLVQLEALDAAPLDDVKLFTEVSFPDDELPGLQLELLQSVDESELLQFVERV